MLFACLQSQAVSRVSIGIFGNADDTSRDGTLVFVFRSEECSGRATVEHRDTETLAAPEYDVCTPFSRRSQQDKTHQVGSNGDTCSTGIGTYDEFFIIFDRTVGIRILDDSPEYIRCEFKCFVITHNDLDALRDHASVDNGQCRGEYVFVDKQRIGFCFHLCTATATVEHGCRFGCCCRFIQQGTVGQRQAGQFSDNSLEIQQRFQTSL